ncbi:hypothetical protein AB0M34_28080 [Nocardia sp. NPDC050193]
MHTLVPDPAPPGRGLVGKGEIVGAATVVGVYRALPEDRGLVGRAHARIGGPSFTEWLDATYPVKG